MTRRAAHMFCLAPVAAALAGCASEKKERSDGRAPSLVYSPAARLDSTAESRESGRDASGPAAEPEAVRPPAGRRCRVHLRREALGVAGQAPYPLSGNNLATERAQLTGTLERVGHDWLVVRGDRSTYWVPREAVLAIEFAD